MKINLVNDTISHEDMDALAEWIKTYPRLTKGPLTLEFESKWSKFLDVKHSTYVNSGSSAVFMALYALKLANRLKNDKIVLPSLCWSTDAAPIIQLGLEPIFCDSNKKDLNINLEQLEEVFKTHQPAALLLVHVLGFINDMDRVVNLCKQYDVRLIEDCCETMGSTYNSKQAGTFGDLSCFSLYFGHTMSSIEGGLVCTNDDELNNILKMIRSHGWDRDLDSEVQNALRKIHGISKFKSIFTFYLPSFNMRATDLQAFLALRQLEKLNAFVKKREYNFFKIRNMIDDSFWKPEPVTTYKPDSKDIIANFAYPLIHPRWEEITNDLIASGVETRPLIAGAVTLHPFVKYYEKTISYATWVEEVVDKQGFYIPNHPELTDEEIKFMTDIINKYK